MPKRIQYITTILLLLLMVCSGKAWGQSQYTDGVSKWTDPSSGITYTCLSWETAAITEQTKNPAGNAIKSDVTVKCAQNYKNVTGDKWTSLVIEASEAINLTGYTFITASDCNYSKANGRNPKSWVIYGSNTNDGTDWQELVSVTDNTDMKDASFIPYTFSCTTTGSYKYFKLIVTKTVGDAYVQFAEFMLHDAAKEKYPLKYYGVIPSQYSYNPVINLSNKKRIHDKVTIKGETSLFTNNFNVGNNRTTPVSFCKNLGAVMAVSVGESATLNVTSPASTDVDAYLYIDADNNDFSATDLVSNTDNNTNSGTAWTVPFTAPSSPGVYRMRFKTEGRDVQYTSSTSNVAVTTGLTVDKTDPTGSSEFIFVGGCATDMMLHVYQPYTLTLNNMPAGASVSVTEGKSVNGTVYTTKSSLAESDITFNNLPVGCDKSVTIDNDNHAIEITFTLTTYFITVTQPVNGSIELRDASNNSLSSPIEQPAGATIYMIATPADGYMLSSWVVKDADENDVEVTNNTFTMPDKAVTVTATFEVAPTLTDNAWVVIQSACDGHTDRYLYPASSKLSATTDKNKTGVIFQLQNYNLDEQKATLSAYYWLYNKSINNWVGEPQDANTAVNFVVESKKKVASDSNTGWAGVFDITQDNGKYQFTDNNPSNKKTNKVLALKSDNSYVVGSNSSTDALAQWNIHVVTPYTVKITGAPGQLTYKANNYYGGSNKQSNGGTYYFEGTPKESDFTSTVFAQTITGTLTIDNVNHTITLTYPQTYAYAMTLVDWPSGSNVKIDDATYNISTTVYTKNSFLAESDFTFTPETYKSIYTHRAFIDNSARTIRAGYAKEYTLTLVNAPAGAKVTMLHDLEGGSHDANGSVYLTQAITVDNIFASAPGYTITKAIDHTNYTITVTYSNSATGISSLSEITDMAGNYYAKSDFTASGAPVGTSDTPFTGTFDGKFVTITGTSSALFGYVKDATIKNVTLDNVTISGDGNVGAIANVASGNARIYNCQVLASNKRADIAAPAKEDKPFSSSSSVNGSGAVGGIVGLIKDNVRVINCVSYADVNGGTYGAGIVGRYDGSWITNTGETVDGSGIMVMNCLMLGDVKSGTNQAPVVGGAAITTGISTYSYFRYPSMPNIASMTQNGALSVETDMWLKRYEFFRSVLNTHRDLAAVYCFDNANYKSEMAKWTIDESISPWPILKAHDENTKKTLNRTIPTTTEDYAGKRLTEMGNGGNLSVNISINGSSYSATLPITDMDTLHYDYTWGKVILPHANEFSTANGFATDWTRDYDYVCIGWEITGMDASGENEFSDYNFADRNCTDKDIYNATTNPFIYAQGGDFIVPYGVKRIDIKAHFAKAYYLADEYYDMDISEIKIVSNAHNGSAKGNGGKRPTTYHGKTVYNTIAAAWSAMKNSKYTPHDQAIVLVGNYHYSSNVSGSYTGRGCTLMSVDEDCDQEPDFSWNFSVVGNDAYQKNWPSMRWDFVPMLGSGTFQICGARSPGIVLPRSYGWWEMTETSIVRTYEYEIYDRVRASADNGKGNNAWIINGGYHQAMIRCKENNDNYKLSYVRLGGNVYIKDLQLGNHSNGSGMWNIRPVNITGGEITNCFMTGMKIGDYIISTNNDNDISFYCSGGKIGKYLSCYMERPVKNATIKIDHAIIDKFYGGGTSPNSPIKGNINITINNSLVNQFCGGPEFGDMEPGKTITVSANGTTFGEYFGAGYGGTALTLQKIQEFSATDNTAKGIDAYNKATGQGGPFCLAYNNDGTGCNFEYETLMNARGQVCIRFFINRALLSLATTHDVSSTLKDCVILKNFYGGGCQGMVDGNIESKLTGCTIKGSAFGGGYRSAVSTVSVMRSGVMTDSDYPTYNGTFGFYTTVNYPPTDEYTWIKGTTNGKVDQTNHTITTTTDMTQMGVVTGAIDLTITNGTVGGSVYGGGNESLSKNNTSVTILGSAEVGGNVYGGGNAAEVQGTTKVQIGEDCNTPQE